MATTPLWLLSRLRQRIKIIRKYYLAQVSAFPTTSQSPHLILHLSLSLSDSLGSIQLMVSFKFASRHFILIFQKLDVKTIWLHRKKRSILTINSSSRAILYHRNPISYIYYKLDSIIKFILKLMFDEQMHCRSLDTY